MSSIGLCAIERANRFMWIGCVVATRRDARTHKFRERVTAIMASGTANESVLAKCCMNSLQPSALNRSSDADWSSLTGVHPTRPMPSWNMAYRCASISSARRCAWRRPLSRCAVAKFRARQAADSRCCPRSAARHRSMDASYCSTASRLTRPSRNMPIGTMCCLRKKECAP